MTTSIHSLCLFLSIPSCFNYTHTVTMSLLSVCIQNILRYLTRSNVTVRTRATLSPKTRAREIQLYINVYQVAI